MLRAALAASRRLARPANTHEHLRVALLEIGGTVGIRQRAEPAVQAIAPRGIATAVDAQAFGERNSWRREEVAIVWAVRGRWRQRRARGGDVALQVGAADSARRAPRHETTCAVAAVSFGLGSFAATSLALSNRGRGASAAAAAAARAAAAAESRHCQNKRRSSMGGGRIPPSGSIGNFQADQCNYCERSDRSAVGVFGLIL